MNKYALLDKGYYANYGVVIFDLDGTLSCGKHRLHLLPQKDHHLCESWDKFNEACVGDPPISNTIRIMNALFASRLHIIILTGRSDHVRCETEKWLDDNECYYDELIMRPHGDNRRDYVFKEEVLKEIGLESIVACYDDNIDLVRYFRKLGLTAYLVTEYEDTESRHDLKSCGEDEFDRKPYAYCLNSTETWFKPGEKIMMEKDYRGWLVRGFYIEPMTDTEWSVEGVSTIATFTVHNLPE